jgi:FAD/FMN-containing dehydrogenase
MTDSTLRNRAGEPVADEKIAAFAEALRGNLIRPGDADHEQARRIWNTLIDKHPGAIARCAGTADVVAAVTFARETDVVVAVRGGGHNVGGRALCDDGLVIDLSRMRGICRMG